jgi:hypothetical protein
MDIDVVREIVAEEESAADLTAGYRMPLARCGRQGKLRRGLPFAQPGTIAGLPAAPLPALLFAASGSCPISLGRESEKERVRARRRRMEKAELEELKDKVPCAAVLEHEGLRSISRRARARR